MRVRVGPKNWTDAGRFDLYDRPNFIQFGLQYSMTDRSIGPHRPQYPRRRWRATGGCRWRNWRQRSACRRRRCRRGCRRLEKDGYIRGYSAVIDRERMGEGHVAFVQVKLSDTRSAALDAFNRAVQARAEIEQCHMMAASFDYLLKVRTTRHRRLPPRARRAHLGPAPCRADLDLRGDGDGEGLG